MHKLKHKDKNPGFMWIVEGDTRHLETDIFQRKDFISIRNIFLYEAFYRGSIE